MPVYPKWTKGADCKSDAIASGVRISLPVRLIKEKMTTDLEIAWFAGLFEGEGSFVFTSKKPKGISICMTDEDIILKVQKIFGGNVYLANRNNQKVHWKQAYLWHLNKNEALPIIKQILPYLGERRSQRGQEFLDISLEMQRKIDEEFVFFEKRRQKIKELYETSLYTHKEIGSLVGMERSHVSRTIKEIYNSVV